MSWGAVGNSLLNEQFGTVDGDKLAKIFKVKGYDREEWIIEYYDVPMSTFTLWKANTVMEIPDEFRIEFIK